MQKLKMHHVTRTPAQSMRDLLGTKIITHFNNTTLQHFKACSCRQLTRERIIVILNLGSLRRIIIIIITHLHELWHIIAFNFLSEKWTPDLPLLAEGLKEATCSRRSEISFSLLLFSSLNAVCSSFIWKTTDLVGLFHAYFNLYWSSKQTLQSYKILFPI